MTYSSAEPGNLLPGLASWRHRIGLLTLIGVCLLPAVQSARACGYEDPASVSLGALNFIYPNALWVGTAVWQARQEGLLPAARAPESGADAALKRGQDERLQAMQALYQLRRRLANDPGMPALAVVFTPAVMWSRLAPQPGRLSLTMHVAGPESEDVVLVTEPAALQAWSSKRLTTRQLLDNGLIRLYGDGEEVARIREAFVRAETFKPDPAGSASAMN